MALVGNFKIKYKNIYLVLLTDITNHKSINLFGQEKNNYYFEL